ncbi:hypothetical protein LTR85_009542 [Meristemomyces frigidus]|nr:hypothetical protein LTR85_009542 [Meristemomyces frigidus]
MLLCNRGALCVIVAGLLLAVASGQRTQQPLQPENAAYFDEAFDAFVLDTIQAWQVPGLSIAIVDGEEVHSKGYGWAVLGQTKATADTQYFAGSTTKAFTAAAVAQLVHDDENYPDLHWTSSINQYIRNDFVLGDEYITSHTTLEDALSHRSGLPRHDSILGLQNDTPSAIVQRMRYLPMTAAPRTTWQYCNIMYVAMTDFLQTVTGLQLETLLRERFWKPLGMKSTRFTMPAGRDASRLARGYYWDESVHKGSVEGRYMAEPYPELLPISGAGATISTVNDYALWIRALLHAADRQEPANESSPISHELFRDLVNPRTIVGDYSGSTDDYAFTTPEVYSLGWLSARVLGEAVITHNGGITGFGTDLYLVPNKSFGVVLMGNTMWTSNVAEGVIAARLLDDKILGRKSDMDIARGGDSDSGIRDGVEEQLRALSQLTLPPQARKHNVALSDPRSDVRTGGLPLPGSIEDYSGLYKHPAYGIFNFTVSSNSPTSAMPALEALVVRLLTGKIRLEHITDTVFELKSYMGHGTGDYSAREDSDVVWEDVPGDLKAVFKFGLDGEVVETLGLELEERMVEVAREKGDKYWKKGMIWFERM